jgi:hypothetical protein
MPTDSTVLRLTSAFLAIKDSPGYILLPQIYNRERQSLLQASFRQRPEPVSTSYPQQIIPPSLVSSPILRFRLQEPSLITSSTSSINSIRDTNRTSRLTSRRFFRRSPQLAVRFTRACLSVSSCMLQDVGNYSRVVCPAPQQSLEFYRFAGLLGNSPSSPLRWIRFAFVPVLAFETAREV